MYHDVPILAVVVLSAGLGSTLERSCCCEDEDDLPARVGEGGGLERSRAVEDEDGEDDECPCEVLLVGVFDRTTGGWGGCAGMLAGGADAGTVIERGRGAGRMMLYGACGGGVGVVICPRRGTAMGWCE
jgi:hypothetical protein